MKKPAVRSRCGSSCRKRPSRRDASRGCAAPRSSALDVRGIARELGGDGLVLAGRDRAGRVDERAARGQRPGRADEQPALQRGEPLARLGRLAPARVGARGERPEIGAGRVQEDPIVARAEVGLAPRRRPRPGAQVDPGAGAELAHLLGPARVDLDRDQLAPVLHPGRDRGRLDPGPGAEVEHPLARARVEQLDDRLRGARLRDQLAGRRPARRPARRPRPTTSAAAGSSSVPGTRARDLDPAGAQLGRERGAGSARRVLTRKAASRGSFIAAISSRASAAPSSSHHIRASHSG